jgi:hypothetical protein
MRTVNLCGTLGVGSFTFSRKSPAMNFTRTLALCAFFASAAAMAGHKEDNAVLDDPCVAKGNEAQDKCSKECFKVDPNQKDQKADKKQLKCMQGCGGRSAQAIEKCREAAAAKKAGPQKKTYNSAEVP